MTTATRERTKKQAEEPLGRAKAEPPQQMNFDIMPDTALGRASQMYVEQKDRIAREKEKLEPFVNDILRVMKKESRRKFRLVHLGETYTFEVTDTKEKLKCVRKLEA